MFLLFEGFFFGGTLGLDTTMLLIELRFLYKKKGFCSAPPFRQQPTDRPSTRVTTVKSKSYVFIQKHSALPFKQQQTEAFYSTCFQKRPKTLTHPSKKYIDKKLLFWCYCMDSQICITFNFVIPISIYKMINNKIPAQCKSPFLGRNSILQIKRDLITPSRRPRTLTLRR